MLTSQIDGKPRGSAPLAVRLAGNVSLSGWEDSADAPAPCAINNDRGPSTGPLTAASRIIRETASGRIRHTSIQEQYS